MPRSSGSLHCGVVIAEGPLAPAGVPQPGAGY